MESQFEQLMQKYGIVSEKNETSLQNYNGLPNPGTEIMIKPEASAHPFVKSKGKEFQEKIAQFITDGKKKSRKYKLLITAVNTIRPGAEYVGEVGGPLGYLVTIVQNHGTHNTGHFELPLETVEVINASWNANGAEVPEEWRQNMDRFNRFSEIVKGYFDRGEQPKGSIANP